MQELSNKDIGNGFARLTSSLIGNIDYMISSIGQIPKSNELGVLRHYIYRLESRTWTKHRAQYLIYG